MHTKSLYGLLVVVITSMGYAQEAAPQTATPSPINNTLVMPAYTPTFRSLGFGQKLLLIGTNVASSMAAWHMVNKVLKKKPLWSPALLVGSGVLIGYCYPFSIADSLTKNVALSALQSAYVMTFVATLFHIARNGIEGISWGDEPEEKEPYEYYS